ncbi:uncharacterized protein B0J16DRAFT_412443 [Fusarium flagelliforme]|uniref:uncharacterized protein n=1 Tax=Fusarium flagelliforme TaxID=2675880 RepID=UPI001E8E9F0B|nr:uncharacterized protein B0J16DRAFT_412443 [Fusarium flagelliforme]KAH7193881.1 hypothetical protein B0J16DRAFT_412443 [Fusarium flagelliforme]
MEQLETTQPLTLAPCEERIEAIADEAATREADAGWAIRIAVSSSARNDVVGVGGTIQISGLGFDHTLEIDGAASIAQSLKSVKLGGVITIIGFLTSSNKQTALMEALNHLCIVRGIFAGSKDYSLMKTSLLTPYCREWNYRERRFQALAVSEWKVFVS